MRSHNTIIVSAAGSGKTADLVRFSVGNPTARILLTTFTIENCDQIREQFVGRLGYVPANVTVLSWLSLLLSEFARPFQHALYDKKRIKGLQFVSGQSPYGIRKSDVERYYFSKNGDIWSDKLADFCVQCNLRTDGAVVKRISAIYDHFFIDEVQDFAGYDLDVLEILLKSQMRVVAVGDIRQSTYKTNNSPKNSGYTKVKIINKFEEWQKSGVCKLEFKTDCFRCIQSICDLADSLYPELPSTNSVNTTISGHDGVFVIQSTDVHRYMSTYSPNILRYDRRTDTENLPALNFGEAKGRTYERVLIFPNGPVSQFLKTGEISHVEKSRAKLYVALTRARQSIAFVHDGTCKLQNVQLQSFQKS